MRRAVRYLWLAVALSALCAAAERKSWTKVRYVGGTIPIRASPYDWNTTLTVTYKPDGITLVIAPASVFAHQQTVRLESSRITTLVAGPGAWQRVAEVSGAQLPAHPPTLFGLLQNHGFLGILYQDDNG